MATNNTINAILTALADGWEMTLGAVARKLKITGADITLTGSGSNVYTFPAATSTLAANNQAVDTFGAPTDITTYNSSTGTHGFLKKLSNTATEFMNGQGAWATPAGGSGIPNDGWASVSDAWTVNSQAYTNDPTSGNDVVLNMADTSKFTVGDIVYVSSSAGVESANVTVVTANTSITVDTLTLNHTTTTPVVISTKLTVPSDATATYTVGDKIKLTQSTVKYFNIYAVTATTISIYGGTNYRLTSAAVSNISYSKISTPVGFPATFNHTLIFTGFSANPTITCSYFVSQGICYFFLTTLGTGTANLTTRTCRMPFIASDYSFGYCMSYDNSVYKNGSYRMVSTTRVLELYVDAFGAWTASGASSWNMSGNYSM